MTLLAGAALRQSTVMFDEAALLEKLRKIEALHAGAATEGERAAAAQAAQRAAWEATRGAVRDRAVEAWAEGEMRETGRMYRGPSHERA